jgi:Zn-dependent peptidase ImmA (M78 family)
MEYQLTPLEQEIKELYHSYSIYRPDQIDMQDIAYKMDVWLHLLPFSSKAISRRGLKSIIIDSRKTEPEQWEDFGHEVSHLKYHVGNQLWIRNDLVEYQETKANNFARHFCVPTFMLLDSGVPATWAEAMLFVMETFTVTENFAKKRLEHFNNQVIGFEFHEALRNEWNALNKMESVYCPKMNQEVLSLILRKEVK